VADHLTEEEQIEAIKRWWQQNWLSIVLPILLAVFAYTGWNYWGDYKEARAAEASDKYQLMLSDLEAGSALSEEQEQNLLAKAEDIRSEYSGTFYADASALLLAKYAAEDGDLVKAESLVRGVMKAPSNESVALLAKARLARILLSADKTDEALTLVSGDIPEGAGAMFAEIRGDIYLAQAQPEAASTAYQEAIDALDQNQMTRFGILQLKLSSVKSSVEPESSPLEDSVAEQG